MLAVDVNWPTAWICYHVSNISLLGCYRRDHRVKQKLQETKKTYDKSHFDDRNALLSRFQAEMMDPDGRAGG